MFLRVNLIKQVLRSQSIAFASTTTQAAKPIPLITCKNTKFNLMKDPANDESLIKKAEVEAADVELASKGWQHYKAKGDHFIIHPSRDVIESNMKESTDFEGLDLNEQLLKNLKEKHDIHKATKLQVDAIREIRGMHNVLIAAETGCGKVCGRISRFQVNFTNLKFRFRLTRIYFQ